MATIATMATTVTITTIAMATITAMTMATLQCEAMLTVNPMDPMDMDIAMDKATIITCISWAGAMTKAMPPTWPR